MRPRTLRAATNAITSSVRRDRPTPRRPYICDNCRQQLSSPSQTRFLSTTQRRAFSITPSFRQQQSRAQQHEAASETSARPTQTHYSLFPSTFPAGPPPASPFTPSLPALRREFLTLQQKSHPDLFPPAEKPRAEALSMLINEAYRTLQDPLRRAEYLLSLQGVDLDDESAKLGDQAAGEGGELLMEVMEAREAVDEVEDEAGLEALKSDNEERMKGSVAGLEAAFAEGNLEAARREAVRLRYWKNIEESIRGWEKGHGGGNNEH
ncbi:unnamed protein product [Zymoseptoria tritici ST99CH_1A5]|uniref:J domain-containing protein n=2 Tax=Zymoseptoria tritici TaxID=1047171 RepID=A0A2H1FLV7_ZYMTR|nr:unnamed protein product [Zymoseptoria tritici ST99CH_1E4]SMY19637.1 unnamed protein product [Zymoseptoria tritici ST99CH_1A5]